jgi:hypothetical protein
VAADLGPLVVGGGFHSALPESCEYGGWLVFHGVRTSPRGLLRRALADTPIVLVSGARQVGKTTLVRTVPAPYMSPEQARGKPVDRRTDGPGDPS